MKRSSNRNGLLIGITLLVVFTGLYFSLSAWLRHDETPLDYSALAVEIGPNDASINGYTQMREFASNYDDEWSEEFDSIFKIPRDEWELEQMKSFVSKRASLLEAFEGAFDQDLFQYDQQISPDTMIPEVGVLRFYVSLRVLESRIAQLEGDADKGLKILLDLEHDLGVFAEAGGGLISTLTAAACSKILNEAIADLLHYEAPSPDALRAAYEAYSIDVHLRQNMSACFRYEFQFVCSCIDMVLDSPGALHGSSGDGGGFWKALTRQRNRAGVHYLFKVNRTKNLFFKVYSEIIAELPKPASARDFAEYRKLELELTENKNRGLFSRNLVGHMLTGILLPTVDGVFDHLDLAQAHGKATRAALALKAYHLEHSALPDSLEVLVPEYLTELPVDPFDGAILRYDKSRAILYSVGNDFTDQGGSDLPFAFQVLDVDERDQAQNDKEEPTFALGFAM